MLYDRNWGEIPTKRHTRWDYDDKKAYACPFCGSRPLVRGPLDNTFGTWYYAECSNVRCQISGRPWSSKDLAIKKWNTRWVWEALGVVNGQV